MLYVTTRNEQDAFTAHRAMTTDTGPGGGQFLPRQTPCFTGEDLMAGARRSFNENIAWVLNLLYGAELTGRDMELAVGERSAGLRDLTSRTMAAEIWRDSDCSFADYVLGIFRLLVKEPGEAPGQWFVMSVRIAVLFAVFAELTAKGLVSEEEPMDVALPSFDFQLPMAAWYARAWGLPIGRIICACNENNAPWSLLHLGEMRTDNTLRHTITAACDQAVPGGLERLIHAVLGPDEVSRYLAAVNSRRPYTLEPEQRNALRAGIWVWVVSQRRMEFMVPNIWRSGRWHPDPYAAMAYTALTDHRSRAGETGLALVLSEDAPARETALLARLLHTTTGVMERRLQKL